MSKWKIYTPEGIQDILFEDCFIKKNIETNVRELFRKSGYFEIETPSIEFYDVFSADTDLTPQEKMFKFFDQQGRILSLRPDMTIPVARIAATKLKDSVYPLRFSYIGNVFAYNELGGGKQKEYTEAGVEVLGLNNPESDAEVIATAINAVKSTGLENFQVDIGQVEFFRGLMEESGLSGQDIEQVRILIDRKDYLGIEEMIKSRDLRNELKELILNLPALFGSTDVIDKVEKISINERSIAALENLRCVIGILEDYGLGKYVSVDLGMVQSLNYYTGIIFKGFTHGIGFPILSGGRYDRLSEKFGKDCPATGFSLGINMIMMALDRQRINMGKPRIDSLICYKKEGRQTAFKVCDELRKQGLSIEMDIAGNGVEQTKKYAIAKEIGGIMYVTGSESIEIHNLESDEVIVTSMKELLHTAENC